MEPWQQDYLPLGSLWLSALAALVPIVFFFVALAVLRLKGHVAAIVTLTLALAIAMLVYGMPVGSALASAIYGFFYGLWPIAWIIVTAVFLYKLTVKSGQFDVIRSSVLSITEDKRMQVLLIGFGFGAFLEGAAGFGAPVAITAALLVGLGFNPLYAAGLCLIANTAPVAFGALGIPVIVAGQVSGLPAFDIGAMTGRQLPFLSVLVPFWLVAMMDGWKGIRETWVGCLISGGTFAVTQFATSNYIGPELPDITSALVSMACLTLYLRTKRPVAVLAGINANTVTPPTPGPSHTLGQVLYAWSPFLILTALVTLWTMPMFKALFLSGGALYWLTFNIEVPWLHMLVERTAPIAAEPTGMPAVFKFDPLAATGSAILIAAIISTWVLKLSPRVALSTFKETLIELRWPIATIGTVLGFAFVTNYSGMSSTLALLLAGTGVAFPFFSPFLGWLGVFLTGSDTSSNALFGALQSATAQQLGLSETLMVAANGSGGVTGKMISPQSISVACAATGLVGKESDLFRFTLKHSLVFATFVGIITLLQAYVFTGMVVGQ